MRALVVDPSVLMSRVIGQALEAAGITEVAFVQDGDVAFDALEASEDDDRAGILVTEMEIPSGGLHLIMKIRAESWGARLPILVVTSRNGRDDVVAATVAGIQGYVLKPFRIESLVARIAAIVAAAEAGAPGEAELTEVAAPGSGETEESSPAAAEPTREAA